MDDWTKNVLKEFIAFNWEAFKQHCHDYETDANEIFIELGGEPEPE